jgi:hypothetical protein
MELDGAGWSWIKLDRLDRLDKWILYVLTKVF